MAKKEVNNVINVVTEPTPVVEVKSEVVEAPVVEVNPVVGADQKVKIKPNATFNAVFGNKRYFFVKGEVQNVPKYVKDILMRQGALDAI